MTIIRKKTIKNARSGKTGENSRNGEYLEINLTQVLYIQYSIIIQKRSILILFNSSNEVNTNHLIFAKKLGFFIELINVKA